MKTDYKASYIGEVHPPPPEYRNAQRC